MASGGSLRRGRATVYKVAEKCAFAKILIANGTAATDEALFIQPSSLLEIGQRYQGVYPSLEQFLQIGDIVEFQAERQVRCGCSCLKDEFCDRTNIEKALFRNCVDKLIQFEVTSCSCHTDFY